MLNFSHQRQVALVLPVNVSWGAVLAQGVADYSREHESWDFTTSPPTMAEAEEVALTPYSLKGWVGQGAIAVINDAAEARAARRLGFPVVCVNGNVRNPGLPRVMPDYYAGGRMAAEHLLDRGSQRLAYFGLQGPWYSAERKRGFVDRARQAKVACEVFDMPPNTDLRASWQQRRHAAAAWLKTLQPPIAILAVHDYRARVAHRRMPATGLECASRRGRVGNGQRLDGLRVLPTDAQQRVACRLEHRL